MPGLIVIRIIPKTPVAPSDFSKYLSPPGLGPLSITAYDLSFNSPTTGQLIGTAAFIAPTSSASPTAPSSSTTLSFPPPTPPQYAPGTGIAQQTDLQPYQVVSFNHYESPYFTLESVATAIIAVPDTLTFENLRLVAQWGTGAVSLPITLDYYDVALTSGGIPDLNGWAPNATDPAVQLDPWASLKPSLYLQLPPPPTAANLLAFQMPTDGTPPAFDSLLTAVRTVLNSDPGTGVTLSTSAAATAGTTALSFASVAGVSVGMAATGTGLAAGTAVAAVDAGSNTVTLNQQLAAAAPAGSAITFAPNLAALSFDQCQNVAYEIIWSQQPALPTPPDPIEDLYTNPPNSGQLLSAGSSTQSHPYEADRQQFEADLQSYYSVADANASRLTNFVYALSAAVACEEMSIAAQQVVLDFPPDPIVGGAGAQSETSVVLTGISSAGIAGNFGVPAAYFYALAATLPAQVTAPQRYQMATGGQITRLLTDLTTAVNTGTITDSEAFVTLTTANTTAAQAARRLLALGVPQGSATPLAPLGSVQFTLTADVTTGTSLPIAAFGIANPGMLVVGANIAPSTAVAQNPPPSNTDITLTEPVLNSLTAGSTVILVPAYPADLQALVADWLAYPPANPGSPSSQSYQPADEAAKFWPQAATAHGGAFLRLVLSAMTQNYFIPAPFNVALGQKIIDTVLGSSPTVTTLASVTVEQWTSLFTAEPDLAAAVYAARQHRRTHRRLHPPTPELLRRRHQRTAERDRSGHHGTLRLPAPEPRLRADPVILQGMSVSAIGIPPDTIVRVRPPPPPPRPPSR